MDERTVSIRPTQNRDRISIGLLLSAALITVSAARADEYLDPCDSSKTSWEAAYEQHKVHILRHERDGYEFHSGTAAEAVRFTSDGDTNVRLSHPVAPPSLVIDDLTASVWVRSSRGGAVLAVRITLPHQTDPQTGAALSFDLRGDEYTSVARWQQLTCQTSDEAVERQLQLVRRRLARTLDGQPLNLADMHVAEVVLVVPGVRGVTDLLVDELRCSPIVRLDAVGPDIRPAGHLTRNERPEPLIQIETNRMLVNGRPFFARIIPYHGENLDTLREIGANVAWVERYDNQILIEQLAERGIWSMAAPPRASGEAGVIPAETGLMPFPESTAPILFWNVGTRVPPSELRMVEKWIDQIRDADRAFARPRPVIADVIGEERRFSRHLSLLGSSRHILHTTVSPLAYRSYLEHKLRLALPDRIKWTLIQTEPAVGNVVTRSASRDRPAFVEAEQIWLQAWTAISVGHKAIGFWRSRESGRLDADTPAAEELRLALSLLNAQIDLLEPWLATGKVVGSVPVSVKRNQSPDLGRQGYGFRDAVTSRPEQEALLAEREREQLRASRVISEVQAAVMDSSYGKLVIPVWYEEGAQFQPGPMAAQNVSFLVRGVGDAQAWQVRTTAVTPLDSERVAGGLEVRLPKMDQHALIVITTDRRLEEKLMQRVRTIRKPCGGLWVELAKAKRDRIRSTHAEIERSGAPKVPDAHVLLTRATQMVDDAEQHLQAEQYPEAERLSRYAMQLLRRLQRTHWENAVANLSAPTTSPHTICFETLPDHWRMMDAIGRSPAGFEENLLRSGDFEDLDSMEVDGWKQIRTSAADPERKIAELDSDAAGGQFCLRMRSSSALQSTMTQPIGPDVVVVSPRVSVRGGQIVLVTGRVRIDRLSQSSPDGLMVYDNIQGTVGALRWTPASAGGQWESFQILREVPSTRDMQLTFELHGDGDVRFDDLRLTALTTAMPGTERSTGTRERGFGRGLLDFTPALPKVRLWPGRKDAEEVRPNP